MSTERTEMILKELEPLFKRARVEGLWFWTSYQDLWFSPDDLEERQREGRFIWGAVNWKLRDPMERLKEMEEKAKGAARAAIGFATCLGRVADLEL